MCGIYVLHFANGEEYVGQTVNFASRFATHRRHKDDITSIRFAAVAQPDLSDVERRMINQLVAEGTRLRNLTLLSQPLGSSAFDLIVDKEYQAGWITAEAPDDSIVIAETRAPIAKRRRESRARLEELKRHPDYEHILDSVAFYVAAVIPWPDTSEGQLWTVTVLPTTNKRKDHRRLLTVNIQNLEVVFIGEDRQADGTWIGYTRLNTAVVPALSPEIGHLREQTDDYTSAGSIDAFSADDLAAIPALFKYPEVLLAARQLALGQLRKGRGAFSRYHNDAFADEVFARIGDWLEEPAD